MTDRPSEYATANKPREIEGVLDVRLIRPLGFLIARALRRTPVTPNQVSAAAVVAAVAAAAAYYHRSPAGVGLGLLFLLLTSALDSADGQLARLTGRTSEVGRILDGVCDALSFLSIYLAIVLSYAAAGGAHVAAAAVLAGLGLASHSAGSAGADFARVLYLFYVYGKSNPERELPEVFAERLGAARGLDRLIIRIHRSYGGQQRLLLPSAGRLLAAHRAAVAARPEVAERFRERYRERHGRFVTWWWLGATNVHKVGLVAASLVPLVVTEGPLHEWGMVTYFVYNLALNLPLVVLLGEQRRRDRGLLAELEDLRST